MDKFKKITIVIIACALLSGCSLFKKVTKEKFEERKSYELEQVSGSKVNGIDKSISGAVSTTDIRNNSTQSKFIKADKVVVRPDGSVEASGGVEFHGLDDLDIVSSQKTEDFKKSNIEYAAEAESRLKAEVELKAKNSKSESKPSGKAILLGAVGVLILALGIMWWLGIGKK